MTQNMGLVVSVVIAALMFACGQYIARLYSDDLVIIKLAADMLKIIAIANPFMNARFIYSSALRGAGDAKYVAVTTFFGVILARPLVALLMINVFGMGLAGIWLGLSSDFVLCFFLVLFRFKRGKWTSIKV